MMTVRRVILLGVALIGVAVIAVSATGDEAPRRPPHGTARTATADPVAALQRDVDLLKQQVRQPHVTLVPAGSAQASVGAGEPSQLDAAPQARKALDPAQVAAMLEAHHGNEPEDRAWTDTLRTELSTVLNGSQTRTIVSAVQCATSLCKVTLSHASLDGQRALASTVAGIPALRAGVFYSYRDGEDPPRTVLYVVREGHDVSEMLAAQ
jgi:hypothetical protein